MGYLPGQCSEPSNDCIVAVGTNTAFCTSSNRAGTPSSIWTLQGNDDGFDNIFENQPGLTNSTSFTYAGGGIGPSGRPDGLTGCTLFTPLFYQDPVTRCNYLYDNCNYQCLDNNFAPLNGQTATTGFCNRLVNDATQFQCDGQWIQCQFASSSSSSSSSPNSNTLTAAELAAYIQLDPDYAINQRMLQCNAYTPSTFALFNNTLILQCPVNEALLLNSADSCATIVSQCQANNGIIKCAEGYTATSTAPLCTTETINVEPSPSCNCGIWFDKSYQLLLLLLLFNL